MKKKIKKNRFQQLTPVEASYNDTQDEHSPGGKINRSRLVQIALASGIFLVSIALILVFLTFYKKPDGLANKPGSIIADLLPKDNKTPVSEKTPPTNDTLARALREYSAANYPSAKALLLEVVESDASDEEKSDALVYLGRIERIHDNTSKAISYFNRALKFNKKNHNAYVELAGAHSDNNDLDTALTHIDRAIELKKDGSDLYLVKGNILFRQGKFNEAKQNYGKAVDYDGENGHAYYNRSLVEIKLGDRFAAIEDLKRAAASGTPRISQLSYSRLGTLFIQNSDMDSAIKYLNLAISSGNATADDLFNLGLAYLNKGEKDKAIEFFQKAESTGTEDMQLVSRLADVYADSYNNYTKSIQLYQDLAQKRSDNAEVLFKLAELFYKNKDYNSALVYFRRVIEMEGVSHEARRAYLYLGAIYDENQRYADAIDSYKSAIDIDPSDDSAFFNLGIAYRNSGDTVNAIESWKKAYQINPDNPKPLIASADLLYENEYLDEAANEYAKIVEKWPSNTEALFSLATIFNRKQNIPSATKYYERVIDLETNKDLTKKSLINLALLTVDSEEGDAAQENLSASISNIKKALLIAPGDREALYALGVIYYKKGLYERAIETFYQVIKGSSDSKEIARSYNNIGKSYFQTGEYRKAIRAFSLGIEEDPSNEEIRINRRSASQKYEEEIGSM